FPSVSEAYFHGFFSTISAVSNGGFDITGQSLQFYQNDYFVQMITMLLIIFGAIGFPVLIEVKEYLFTDRKSTRLNSSHVSISYAVFCLKKKKKTSGELKRRQSTSHLLASGVHTDNKK